VDDVKPIRVSEFARMSAKGRKVHWNVQKPANRRLGSTGKPEIAATADNGAEIWIPVDYCISTPFDAETMAAMVADVPAAESEPDA